MIGGYVNEEKIKRSMEADLKRTFDGDDFELGARRIYDLRKIKDNPFVTFSSDRKKTIAFPTYEDTRLHVIERQLSFRTMSN